MDFWSSPYSPDAAYCIGRALIIGIVVSSELAVAGRRRTGFERHLLLAVGFGVLLFAEIFVAGLSVLCGDTVPPWWARLSLFYPAFNAIGLAVAIPAALVAAA